MIDCPLCGASDPIEELDKIDPEVKIYLCLTCEETWIEDHGKTKIDM